MYLGCAASEPECLYFLELGKTHVPSNGLPERFNRSSWVSHIESKHSTFERVSLADAMEAVYPPEEPVSLVNRLMSRLRGVRR
jgi:hypothetical protein